MGGNDGKKEESMKNIALLIVIAVALGSTSVLAQEAEVKIKRTKFGMDVTVTQGKDILVMSSEEFGKFFIWVDITFETEGKIFLRLPVSHAVIHGVTVRIKDHVGDDSMEDTLGKRWSLETPQKERPPKGTELKGTITCKYGTISFTEEGLQRQWQRWQKRNE